MENVDHNDEWEQKRKEYEAYSREVRNQIEKRHFLSERRNKGRVVGAFIGFGIAAPAAIWTCNKLRDLLES